MSTPQQPTFRFPFALDNQPHQVQQAHIFAFNAILDLQRANAITASNIKALQNTTATASTSTNTITNTVTIESILAGLGTVNDQTGQTAYTTQTQDAGALVILGDASPIAVTLNSVVATPFALLLTNFGAGAVTLTPTSGTINGGASLSLLQGQTIWTVFDGTNWKTGDFTTPPQNTPSITHEFLTAYNAATGVFSQAQPAFTDISGVASPAQLPNPTVSTLGGVEAIAPIASNWVNSINTSGAPQLSQPAFTDISGSLAAGQLPAGTPVVSFGTGAPSGSSTEGYLYFDTTASPYTEYVFHSGAWHQVA